MRNVVLVVVINAATAETPTTDTADDREGTLT